jgi:ketosteroid isomerase-like protein
MSQGNVEVVRRLYAFWQDRDYSVIAGLVHPEAVVDMSRNVFNPGVHRGLEGLRRVVEQTDEMWDDFRIIPVEIIDAGDSVFVANRITGKGRGSGVEAEMLIFGVCEFREGKVIRFTGGLRDRSEALEVAGLSE